jgi:hypothetical protein
MFSMSRISTVLGTMLALTVFSAHAQTSPTTTGTVKKPLSQAIKSVGKNLSKDPDNKGLQNASEKLDANQQKIEERRADRIEKSGSIEKADKVDKVDKVEKVEKIEKLEKIGRGN